MLAVRLLAREHDILTSFGGFRQSLHANAGSSLNKDFDISRKSGVFNKPNISQSTHFGCCRLSTPKVHKFFQRIVREVITYRENNNVTRADYLQHLITLSKKGSIADDKDLSSGHTPQQNSRYTPRLSTLLMFGIRRV
jgi:hypothetical protein